MNRNRFINPPPNYNNENKVNPLNYQCPLPRFGAWQNNLPINQNIQPAFPTLPPPKKNYCSTCDLWTVEPYNVHQASTTHIAKKTALRISQNYPPLYGNVNNNTSINNNNNNNINNNNVNSNKRKYRKARNRVANNQQNQSKKPLTTESIDQNKTTSNDFEQAEDKYDEKSQSSDVDFELKEFDLKVTTGKNRGLEMLIPVTGVFCALCEVFLPDKDLAENEHCSSQSHCDAYENLLKKVQNSKNEKRGLENQSENVDSSSKRMKADCNVDCDFRPVTNSEKNVEQKLAVSSNRDSDEIDKISTGELLAPDFSLEFPDDIEDYDEGEIQSNSNLSSPDEKRDVSALLKDD